MVLMVMLFVGEAIIRQRASFFLAPATVKGLRSVVPVRTAAIGRLFRIQISA